MFDGILGPVLFLVVGIILVIAVILSTWKKVPADKAAIITGIGKAKVVTGGGVIVVPVLQRIDYITLENMRFDISMRGAMTKLGVPIGTDGVVVIKVKNEAESIMAAVEQFNSASQSDTAANIINTAKDVSEGKLREIIATLTVEEIYKDRETFAANVQSVAGQQLLQLGLELKSFTIKDISDQNGYLEAMGKPQIAAVKRDADIAEAEAMKERMIKTSEAKRAGEQAKLEAEARISEAQKEADIKRLDYEHERQAVKAKTDAAYSIQENITLKEVTNTEMDAAVLKEQRAKEVKEAEIQIQITAEQKNIELAKKRAERKEAELQETAVKPAEASKRVAELNADALKYNEIAEAQARTEAKKLDAVADAESIRQKGQAQADVIRQTGEAEAQAILQKGLAKAEAMEKEAEAYAKWGQAAMTKMVVEQLPEIARSIAEPMSRIGNITIIGGGDGQSGSATDVARMTIGTLKAVTEGVKDTLGFDIMDVMKANTYDGKTTNNLNLSIDGLETLSPQAQEKIAPAVLAAVLEPTIAKEN